MNNKRFFFLIFLLLFLTQIVFSFGSRERVNVIQITGIVRLIGSSHLPELVISGDEFEWHIPREERDKLHHLQHQTVTVEGEETVREITFASGIPAGKRRELRNIRVIVIH